MSSLGKRLERLEQQAPLEPDLTGLDEWALSLELDDLSCVVATGPRSELIHVPEGMTLDEARVRGYEVLQTAPEPIRRLLDDSVGEAS